MSQHIAGCLMLIFLILPNLSEAASGADTKALSPSSQDKCPVCGMFVAKYPSWIAGIRFKEHATVYFDGPKDLFKYYFNTGKYNDGKSPADIGSIFVTEYYSVTQIDAIEAFFVVGSDVYGPMGKELIPFADAAGAEEFLRDHSGKAVFTFEEVTPDLLRRLE